MYDSATLLLQNPHPCSSPGQHPFTADYTNPNKLKNALIPNSPEASEKLESMQDCRITLKEGRLIEIKAERLKTILTYLKNLYNFKKLNNNGKIRFHNHQAAELTALQELMQNSSVRRHGGEHLISLGKN